MLIFGIEVILVGVCDVILFGEMKVFFNWVIEVKKVVEVNFVMCCEEMVVMCL